MNLKYFLFYISLFLTISVKAQKQSGTIKYKQTTYIETENIPANMAMDMPKSFEAFMRLSFNRAASLYEKDPDYKEEVNPNDNTPRMFRRMRERSNKIVYTNIQEAQKLEQINLFGKDFLVTDSIAAIKWKVIANEQKTILGYTCMKAIFKDSTNNLVVFFTPQLPVSCGPDKFAGLPGVILEVQSAQLHILATEIKTEENNPQPPTKGQKVSQKEFQKIREEKMKEQREMWGGDRSNMRVNRP